MPRTKTTKQHFRQFKKYVLKYIKLYGLLDWELDINHDTEYEGYDGATWVNYEAKHARIHLGSEVATVDMELIAYHEVLELLLYPLREVPECIHEREDYQTREVHSIIQRLLNVHLGHVRNGCVG